MMTTRPPHESPFKLDFRGRGRLRQSFLSMVAPALERVLEFPVLNTIYHDTQALDDDRHFVEKVLSVMEVTYEISDEELARIPAAGPLIVVANHPFGAIEGLVLTALLRSVRPDVKILANYLLSRIPELRDSMLFVDPFGSREAVSSNIRSIRASIDWVKQGGMLGVFPAGEVSHLDMRCRAVTDPAWSPTIARIVRKTGAAVLPVFFHGTNGPLFQLLGMVHPRLRTAMLPHELVNKKRTTIPVRVGSLIPSNRLASFANDQDLTDYLRLRTYILKNRPDKPLAGDQASSLTIKAAKTLDYDPIVEPEDPALMIAEVASLPPEALISESGSSQVYIARAPQIPHLLREIGRLREITFRQVNEGTGKAIDLDAYDQYYLQLFVWNKERQEIIGAYRLGPTDEILPRFGLDGLYTHSLFNYQHGLLSQIDPALELGRSFVRPEYQKSYSPLLLLWKGIGQYVTRNPRYRMLFGPVSINSEYQSVSRQLIITFLRTNNFLPDLARLLKPKNPPRVKPISFELRASTNVVRDMDEVSDLVSEIETDQKGIPILLKQYLKLGAKLLGFNVDPDFGDVLDGLMLVDLTQTDPRILEKYLGKEGYKSFMAYQEELAAR